MKAVIEILQYYDEISWVKCIGTADTEEQAQEIIQRTKKEQDELGLKRKKYIDEFVDKIEIPEENYHQWRDDNFEFFKYERPQIGRFKYILKSYLNSNSYKLEFNNYNAPPQVPWLQFFVDI